MSVRVRFAPSPTGALHIGGVRTALYNYLFARQNGGQFLLRIEDTDQSRFVPGAEEYIIEALRWCGLLPDEGVGFGGDFGPYRQSDRAAIYQQHTQMLLDADTAYYAFDTPEELNLQRQAFEARGETFIYNQSQRMQMRNSLTMSKEEVSRLLAEQTPYVVRLRVPEEGTVVFQDLVRGEVSFAVSQLDDKVMMKGDGLPTYHLANVVDDYSMKITHVIRGEEWLPSTPTHVLLYRAFGWQMPQFAHLPLILKPNGKGKLSKRDGKDLGIPVFPLDFVHPETGDQFSGFREAGFLPAALLNFLAFLGWSPTDEQEYFTLEQLIEAFDLQRVHKAGARFNYEKARWFNQQHLAKSDNQALAQTIAAAAAQRYGQTDLSYLTRVVALMKERVNSPLEIIERGYYLFEPVHTYDEKAMAKLLKKWTLELGEHLQKLGQTLAEDVDHSPPALQTVTEAYIAANGLAFGDVMQSLRLALSGTLQGPSVFDMIALLGINEFSHRLRLFAAYAAAQTPT